jgi:hypothetical protein
MKNIFFASLLLLSYTGIAQKVAVETAKLPVPVKFAFEGMFPTVKGNAWFINKKTQYTTTIEPTAGKEVRVWITFRGETPKLIEDIDKKELPMAVKDASDKRVQASMKVEKYSRETIRKYGLLKVKVRTTWLQSISDGQRSWVNKFNDKGKYLGKQRKKLYRTAF